MFCVPRKVVLSSSVFLTTFRSVTYRQKMPPPDRWLDYSNFGNVIPGTNILCFKVPLKHGLLRQVPADMWFTPKQLIDHVEKEHKNLKLVIDLTFTRKYYFTEEFTKNGVDHLKIFTEGHVIPSDDVVHRFFDAVETTKASSDDDAVIGVHCTHGLNRTGYMVCRYMIERLAFKPEEAIQAFNTARGHDMERQNYIANLHTKTFLEDYQNQERHRLEQKKPNSTNHSHKHSNRQQRSRSGSQGKDFHNHDDQNPGSHGYHSQRHNGRRSGSRDKDAHYWHDGHSSSHCSDDHRHYDQRSGSHGNDAHRHYDRRSGSHGNDAHRHYDRRSGSRDKETYWHKGRSDSHSKGYHTDAYHNNARYEPLYEDRYPYGEYTYEIEEGKRDMQNESDGWGYRGQRYDNRGHGKGSRYQGQSYKGQGQDWRGQQYVREDDWRRSRQGGWENSDSGRHSHQPQSKYFRGHERSGRHESDKYSRSQRSRDGESVKDTNSLQESQVEYPDTTTQQQISHDGGSQHDNHS